MQEDSQDKIVTKTRTSVPHKHGEESEQGGKYAAEAFEMFRLFARLGRSLDGLVLLEFAWILTIKLAAGIGAEEGKPAALSLPVIRQWYPLIVNWSDVKATEAVVAGSFVVLVGWALYSRLYLYIVSPLAQVFRFGLKIIAMPLLVVALLITLPIMLVTWPAERWLLRRVKRKDQQEWIARFREKYPDQDAEAAWSTVQQKLIEKHGAKTLEQVALENVHVKKDAVQSAIAILIGRLRAALHSSGRIGIAPLVSYTYSEDFQAAKVQVQVFALAIAKLHSVLREYESVKLMRFMLLPTPFKITSHRQAAFISRLFGLDLLLWGSYVDASGEVVWMNIHIRGRKTSHRDRSDDNLDAEYHHSFFPYAIKLQAPAVIFRKMTNANRILSSLLHSFRLYKPETKTVATTKADI